MPKRDLTVISADVRDRMIVQEYANGKTKTYLANKYGLSQKTIYAIIKKNGELADSEGEKLANEYQGRVNQFFLKMETDYMELCEMIISDLKQDVINLRTGNHNTFDAEQIIRQRNGEVLYLKKKYGLKNKLELYEKILAPMFRGMIGTPGGNKK